MIFFFQAEDGIRDGHVTGVQTCALPISRRGAVLSSPGNHLRVAAPLFFDMKNLRKVRAAVLNAVSGTRRLSIIFHSTKARTRIVACELSSPRGTAGIRRTAIGPSRVTPKKTSLSTG